MLYLDTIILATAIALILVGIWHEEKLIAFERKIADFVSDRIGYCIAQVIIHHRKRKAAKLRAERNARANEIAKARRSRIHIVSDNTAGYSTTSNRYIA